MKKSDDYRDSSCSSYMSNYCLHTCNKCSQYKEERKEELQREFEDTLPCKTCINKDICRYANSVKRFDFNKEIFTITIECRRRVCKQPSPNQDQ